MDFSRSHWHLLVFAVLFLAGLVLTVWQVGEQASTFILINTVIQEMDAVVVVSAAVAILGVDGVNMFAESYLRKRYRDGIKEGKKRVLDDLVRRKVISDEQRRELEQKHQVK